MSDFVPTNLAIPFLFFPGNSTPVVWSLAQGLTMANPTPSAVDDAVGDLTIRDASGNAVTGANALPFAPTSVTGEYLCNIDGNSFNPRPGNDYSTTIAMTSAKYGFGQWVIPTCIRLRTTP